MADMLALLKGEQLVEISEDFDYLRATEDFVGLKLFPLAKTENMKLAIYNLVDGADVPVMAFVHALDTEARIGDRPDAQELKFELFLIKEKLNQGEAIRKKIKDLGMGNSERAVLEAIYNDASNLISRVLTRMEVMACELLSTGRITVKENNVDKTVDFGLKAEHYITVADWATPSHDIIGDLVKVKNRSKGKIVRALVSSDVMQKMLANEQFAKVAGSQSPVQYVTAEWVKRYISALLGIEFVVVEGTYKKSARDTEEFNFFKDGTVCFLETTDALGNTFVTSSPEEDYGIANYTNGLVSVTQYTTNDPAGIWTKASAIAFPCPKNVNQMWICKVL